MTSQMSLKEIARVCVNSDDLIVLDNEDVEVRVGGEVAVFKIGDLMYLVNQYQQYQHGLRVAARKR